MQNITTIDQNYGECLLFGFLGRQMFEQNTLLDSSDATLMEEGMFRSFSRANSSVKSSRNIY